MELITNKLIDSKVILKNKIITIDELKEMLYKKFKEIDYEDAKRDIMPFIIDTESLNIWSENFFVEITKNIKPQ